jgi:hypothetical protein
MRLAIHLAVLASLLAVPATSAQVDLKAPWERVEAGNEISFTAFGDTLFIQGEIVGNQDDLEISTDAGATVTEVDLDDVVGRGLDVDQVEAALVALDLGRAAGTMRRMMTEPPPPPLPPPPQDAPDDDLAVVRDRPIAPALAGEQDSLF